MAAVVFTYLFWLRHAAHGVLAYRVEPVEAERLLTTEQGTAATTTTHYHRCGHCRPDFPPLNLHKHRQDGHYLCREGDHR